MSRKLQKKDYELIERLRNSIRESSQLSTTTPQNQSIYGDSCFDEFHDQILKHSRIASIKIVTSQVLTGPDSSKQHTVYEIQVVTDEVNYQVSRRYSEFYDLYKKIKKFLPFGCVFPRKNYNPFVSSTSQAIVEERMAKLNAFLQEVFQFMVSQKQPVVSLCFFNFIQLKETYQNQYIGDNQYKKTSSEKGKIQRYYTMKSSLSEKNLGVLGQNSIEFHIGLINDRLNPGKNLSKLQQFVKNRRQKATNQQIKILFMGFGEYIGLLKFGLTNFLQANRTAALQMIVDLLMPESNIMSDKYERVLQRLPSEMWIVEDIGYFDNSIFKVLYFKLLSVYCERVEKEHNKSEATILKSLFLFHQNLMNDYFQYKKINRRVQFNPVISSYNLRENVEEDFTQKINISEFQDNQNNLQVLTLDDMKAQGLYYKSKNTLILKFGSLKTIQQIEQASFKWNRLVESYSIDDYTGLYKYSLCSDNKKWNLRLKVTINHYNKDEKTSFGSHLIPDEVPYQIKQQICRSQLKISKSQSPFDICPEYQQQIWVQQLQNENKVLIAVKVARDIDIFEGSLRGWGYRLCEDALVHL